MQTKQTITHLVDLPAAPCTIDTMAWNQTGTWRYLTPVPLDRRPPCNQACPLAMPISRIMAALSAGRPEAALALVLGANPLPGLTSRLCYHPCQTACLRKTIDNALTIQRIARFVASQPPAPAPAPEPIPLQVTILGAGPLGLSLAERLARAGATVRLLAAQALPGGALTRIPAERFDPQLLAAEVRRCIEAPGVSFAGNQHLDPEAIEVLAAQAEIIVLDPTGDLSPRIAESFDGFDPSDPATLQAGRLTPILDDKLLPFKASRIAHYVCAGKMTAARILAGRNRNHDSAAAAAMPALDPSMIRIERFAPTGVVAGGRDTDLDTGQAVAEAGRCLSCGTCNRCGRCIDACPDASIHLQAGALRPSVDLYHCKGCGICAYECPRGVIAMEETTA